MFSEHKITQLLEQNKSVIWGLFLLTLIFKFAIGSIFLILLFLLSSALSFQRKRVAYSSSFIPLAAYFLWGVASLIWTTDFPNTLNGIGITLPMLLITMSISQHQKFEVLELRSAFRVFSLGLLLYLLCCSLVACMAFFQDRHWSHFFYHDLVSIFDNNAIYVSLGVAICLLVRFNLPDKKRSDYFILAALGFFLLVLSSKNMIVTTLVLLTVSLFNDRRTVKSGVGVSIFLALALAVVFIFDNPIKARFVQEMHLNIPYVLNGQDFYDYKFSGMEVRLFQWRVLYEAMAQGQLGLLGLGLHNIDYLLDQYFNYYNLYKGYFQINFHNQYLQTFGEIGCIGLGLLLWFFVSVIRKAIRLTDSTLLMVTVLFLVAFLTESFLNRQKGVFLFVTVYSLLLHQKKVLK